MEVEVKCTCPAKPDGEPRHDRDTVTLAEPLPPRVRRALLYDASLLEAAHPEATTGDKLALFNEGYIRHCVSAWSFVGADNKPLPVSAANIQTRIFEEADVYDVLAIAADDLYSEAVLLPLLARALVTLPPSPTDESTSQEEASSAESPDAASPAPTSTPPTKPRKNSSTPSLTSTTQTGDIGAMLASSGSVSN